MEKDKFVKAMLERRPICCSECHGRLKYMGGGHYECYECGHEEIDDFGKVKDFIDENGPSPALVISDCTGVPVEYINGMLREGRLEIPEGSQIFIKCEKCGCSIRFGRYCPDCLKAKTKSLQGVYFNPDFGEKPRDPAKQNQKKSKMRFLGMD